MAQTIDHIKKI